MNTVAISAAVSAIVTVIVGTLINWGGRVTAFLRRRLTPDHLPISGSAVSSQAASSNEMVKVLVSCAPFRSLRCQEIDPDNAIGLVRTQFPGRFPSEPVFSMPEYGVRFEVQNDSEREYVWVHASGRLDLVVNIPTTSAEPGPITISIVDVVRPILEVLCAVRSDEWKRTFGRRRRGFRHRFDWAIAVSQTVVTPKAFSTSWQHLTFPGDSPPRVGTTQQAYCPPRGYGFAGLRSWKLNRPEGDLIRVFVRDFLYQNGFHNVDRAVHDIVQALPTI